MFRKTDAAGIAEEAALTTVLNDRRRFIPYFRAVEEYAYANNLVIAGEAATGLLLEAPLDKDGYHYEVLADKALVHVRAIADALLGLEPEGLGRFVYARTVVPRRLFVIFVDERALFTLRELPAHRETQISRVVIPSVRPARFARREGGRALELYCVGPELRLIGTYAALSDPAQASAWPELLATEARLRALFLKEIQPKIDQAVALGGEEAEESSAGLKDLVRALLRDYVCRTGLVLVGTYAAAAWGADLSGRPPLRLQVVTSNPFRAEEESVRKIAAGLGLGVEASVSSVKVPTDSGLQRMTLYLSPGPGREKREAFLDVFDTGARELVPFADPGGRRGGRQGARRRGARKAPRARALPPPPNKARLGTFFVLLRFCLVDVWTIQLLLQISVISPSYARQRLESLVGVFRAVAAEYAAAAEDPERFAQVFPDPEQDAPLQGFVGSYLDPVIAQKRASHAQTAAGNKHFQDYYPARGGKPPPSLPAGSSPGAPSGRRRGGAPGRGGGPSGGPRPRQARDRGRRGGKGKEKEERDG